MSDRFRVLCQRGITWFITYPKAMPESGSANPSAPPVPKCPKLWGLGPSGRRAVVGWEPTPNVTSSPSVGQYRSHSARVA